MSILLRTSNVSAVFAEDKRKFLHSLTREKAWRIYCDLCNAWEENPNKQGIEYLEQRRIRHLLELRGKLDRIGGRSVDGYSEKRH
jgi:hypothetical protein